LRAGAFCVEADCTGAAMAKKMASKSLNFIVVIWGP
jgi:hypothetical protein